MDSPSHPERAGPLDWQPRELVAAALKRPQQDFERAAEAPMYLLLDTRKLSVLAVTQLVARASQYPGLEEQPNTGYSTIISDGDGAALAPAAEPPRRSADELRSRLTGSGVVVMPIRARHAEHKVITLGRTSTADIPMKHKSVSKVHAVLKYEDDGALSLREAGSKNGTFINGERHTGTAALKSGDALVMGQVRGFVVDPALLWQLLDGVAQTAGV
jgi:hypothetical protein